MPNLSDKHKVSLGITRRRPRSLDRVFEIIRQLRRLRKNMTPARRAR